MLQHQCRRNGQKKDSEKFWTMKELGENVKETMMVVVGLRGEFILKQNIKRGLPN